MPTPIRMPDLGTAETEVRLLKWLVEEGQEVRRGTLLAELHSEVSMHSHADKAIEILRARQPHA